MNLKKFIVNEFNKSEFLSPKEIVDKSGKSEQAVHKVLRDLESEKVIKKIGKAPIVFYTKQTERKFKKKEIDAIAKSIQIRKGNSIYTYYDLQFRYSKNRKEFNLVSKSIQQAAENLGLTARSVDENGNFLEVEYFGKIAHFIHNIPPLNSQVHAKVASDKEFSYKLLSDFLPMQKTIGFLDPNVADNYKTYLVEKSYMEIIEKIESEFTYPLIVKKNSGSSGINVFQVKSRAEVVNALKTIYDRNSSNYDYIALAQEMLRVKKEFRVIVLDGQVQFAYQRDNSDAKFTGNLSPLHWDGGKAVLVFDDISGGSDLSRISASLSRNSLDAFAYFAKKVHDKMGIRYTGLDIFEDIDGNFVLGEVNSHPSFDYFIRDNGTDLIVKLYENILRKWCKS